MMCPGMAVYLEGRGTVSKKLFYRLISIMTLIRIPFRVLTYLISPPTLKVEHQIGACSRRHPSLGFRVRPVHSNPLQS